MAKKKIEAPKKKHLNNVLLIWEEIPETIKTYSLEVDDETLDWMDLCHRHYINIENDPDVDSALDRLNAFLEDKEPNDDETPRLVGLGGPEHLILSGFVL